MAHMPHMASVPLQVPDTVVFPSLFVPNQCCVFAGPALKTEPAFQVNNHMWLSAAPRLLSAVDAASTLGPRMTVYLFAEGS